MNYTKDNPSPFYAVRAVPLNGSRPITWKNCTSAARWLMAREWVGTPYQSIAAEAAERAQANYPRDRRARAAAVTAFLIEHRRNRALYADVMGGAR